MPTSSTVFIKEGICSLTLEASSRNQLIAVNHFNFEGLNAFNIAN